MFGYRHHPWAGGTGSFEKDASGFPLDPVGDLSRWGHKSDGIRRNVPWLDHELPILVFRFSPTRHLDTHFPGRPEVVPREYSEYGCGFEMSDIVYDDLV